MSNHVLSLFSDFLDNLQNDMFSEKKYISWQPFFEKYFGIKAEEITLFDTMYQAISRTTYHRGKINKTIKELGGKPVTVDYITWAWMGKPKFNLKG